jgi:hypothetical protein
MGASPLQHLSRRQANQYLHNVSIVPISDKNLNKKGFLKKNLKKSKKMCPATPIPLDKTIFLTESRRAGEKSKI